MFSNNEYQSGNRLMYGTLSYLAVSEIQPKRKIKSPNSFLNYLIY